MILKLMKNDALDLLSKDIEKNIVKYGEKEQWIDQYFENKNMYNYYYSTGIDVPDIELTYGGPQSDWINAKELYMAMKKINVVQASDLRLWAYLTHCTYWGYMNERWNIDGNSQVEEENIKTIDKIKTRYFFKDKPYVRNGIARLWWGAYLTYDEKNKNNEFEYTQFFLSKQDIFASSTERSLGRNKTLLLAALKVLKPVEKINREQIREYFAQLNQAGGTIVLDALNQEQATELCKKTMENVLNRTKK